MNYEQLWRVLERFASTLVGQRDLESVFEDLGAEMRAALGVSGAGVMLEEEQGVLRFRSASDPVLKELERLQIELDEGPCLLAFRTGEPVIAADLSQDRRFPAFGPKAIDAGMASVYSFPMRFDDEIVGAVNLYDRDPRPLTQEQIEVGETLADVATSYLLHAAEVDQLRGTTRQLQHALQSRVVVEQAKGFVAALAGVDVDEAKEWLRSYARRNQTRLNEIARRVMAREIPLDDLRP